MSNSEPPRWSKPSSRAQREEQKQHRQNGKLYLCSQPLGVPLPHGKKGEKILNLLSQGIANADGTPCCCVASSEGIAYAALESQPTSRTGLAVRHRGKREALCASITCHKPVRRILIYIIIESVSSV
jgi:hypothetical protein